MQPHTGQLAPNHARVTHSRYRGVLGLATTRPHPGSLLQEAAEWRQ